MDFEEWLRKHEREVFKRNQGCFDKAYIFGAKNGFKAGQQSKQAEIDALKSKVQELWTELDDRQSKEYIIERCELIIQELLK